MSTARRWIVVLLLVAISRSVSAQSQSADDPSAGSRAALLAAERQKNSAETSPPQRSKVENWLYLYDNWSGLPFVMRSWNGFRLGGGGFPAGAGTAIGASFSRDLGRMRPAADVDRPNRMVIDTLIAYSTRSYFRGATAFSIQHLGGAPLSVRVHGQHYEFPQDDFFGFGQDSLEDNRTNYSLRSNEAGGEARWQPSKLVEVSGGVSYVAPRTDSGEDNRFPSTEQIFNPATIPAYTTRQDFLRSDASVALDWRDNPLHPHAGGRYAVQFSAFNDRGLDAFDFRRVSIDLQQYVPIPDRYRTIALRAAAVFTDASTGQDVPFFYQPTLGGARALRGFREFRFRDRDALILSAEYRWEAWWALDGALFVDAGTVAPERKGLSLRNFDASYGFGFRLHSNSAFVARLDLAFSREGFIPLLRFEHVF